MLEVVKMLEGDGLTERWDEWQKEIEEMFVQGFNHGVHANTSWIIVDSADDMQPDELFGPR